MLAKGTLTAWKESDNRVCRTLASILTSPVVFLRPQVLSPTMPEMEAVCSAMSASFPSLFPAVLKLFLNGREVEGGVAAFSLAHLDKTAADDVLVTAAAAWRGSLREFARFLARHPTLHLLTYLNYRGGKGEREGHAVVLRMDRREEGGLRVTCMDANGRTEGAAAEAVQAGLEGLFAALDEVGRVGIKFAKGTNVNFDPRAHQRALRERVDPAFRVEAEGVCFYFAVLMLVDDLCSDTSTPRNFETLFRRVRVGPAPLVALLLVASLVQGIVDFGSVAPVLAYDVEAGAVVRETMRRLDFETDGALPCPPRRGGRGSRREARKGSPPRLVQTRRQPRRPGAPTYPFLERVVHRMRQAGVDDPGCLLCCVAADHLPLLAVLELCPSLGGVVAVTEASVRDHLLRLGEEGTTPLSLPPVCLLRGTAASLSDLGCATHLVCNLADASPTGAASLLRLLASASVREATLLTRGRHPLDAVCEEVTVRGGWRAYHLPLGEKERRFCWEHGGRGRGTLSLSACTRDAQPLFLRR